MGLGDQYRIRGGRVIRPRRIRQGGVTSYQFSGGGGEAQRDAPVRESHSSRPRRSTPVASTHRKTRTFISKEKRR